MSCLNPFHWLFAIQSPHFIWWMQMTHCLHVCTYLMLASCCLWWSNCMSFPLLRGQKWTRYCMTLTHHSLFSVFGLWLLSIYLSRHHRHHSQIAQTQRLVLSSQCGWGVFSSLYSGVSATYRVWAQDDEPRQADSQWVRPECGQVNIADSLELAERVSRLHGWLVFYGLCGSWHYSS